MVELWFKIVCDLQTFWIGHHCFPDHLTPFQLLLNSCMVIFKTIFTQFPLYFYLMQSIPQEGQLSPIKIFLASICDIVRLLIKQSSKLISSILSFHIIFIQRRFKCRNLLPYLQQFFLTCIQMIFSQLSQNTISDQLNKITYLLASCCVFITKWVKNYTAIYIHIFTQGIVLKCVFCIYYRRWCVFLLLFCLLPEESLVVLEIL